MQLHRCINNGAQTTSEKIEWKQGKYMALEPVVQTQAHWQGVLLQHQAKIGRLYTGEWHGSGRVAYWSASIWNHVVFPCGWTRVVWFSKFSCNLKTLFLLLVIHFILILFFYTALMVDFSQIFKATYSGVPVYEMLCKGVAVMRRRSDSYLNATQILKVADFDKPQRTRILEREVQTGQHEKVQGGYGKYQGMTTCIHTLRQLVLTCFG